MHLEKKKERVEGFSQKTLHENMKVKIEQRKGHLQQLATELSRISLAV